MQNKCNCGCDQGFVPVNGNWDFNMGGDCGCQQNYVRRNRRDNDCGCDEYGKNYTRARNDNDCQCERCDDDRTVACCDQNTYIRQSGSDRKADCGGQYDRDKDNCECKDQGRNRGNDCKKCDECGSAYYRERSACTGHADCPCETCARTRRQNRGNCGCEDEGKYTDNNYTRRRTSCGCDKDNASTYARSGKNRRVGMINVEKQEIDEIFESESALRAGTLFPELHKPMNGYCPCDKNCGTCKQQAAFAAWEMRLYLNTHPNDKEALALFHKLCKEAEDENYATTFLTDECCTSGGRAPAWNWVKNPWPWEYDCQCGD